MLRTTARVLIATAASLGVALAGPASGPAAAGEGPSIAGNYKLVKRTLPDGSELTPPDVVGFMTFTAKYRNFNVTWKDPEGQRTSISYVAKYELTGEKYCEKPLYWMQNNLAEPGLKYGAPPEKGECSAVETEGGALIFPIRGEPVTVRFQGDALTATAEGSFVDHWKKVD